MSLDRELERFAAAHAAELDAAETFTLGRAAGIVARVHRPYLEARTERDAPVTDRDGPT